MYSNPVYTNAEETIIVADKASGGKKCVEQAQVSQQTLWGEFISGDYGSIAPYAAPQPDPEGDLAREREGMVVSAFQAKAALSNASLYVAAENAVTLAGGITLLAWQTAIEYRRNSPTILALQVTLNLTDVQVDDLFRAAALIDA